MIKTLTEICTQHIVSNIGFFKKNLDTLPLELKSDIQEKDFHNRYERIGGVLYRKTTYFDYNSLLCKKIKYQEFDGNWDYTKKNNAIHFNPYSTGGDWCNYKT